MVPLDRALVSSYRPSIVTVSLTAAVWPQFATQVFRGGIGRLTCIGSYVNKQITTFTFRAQPTTWSKHHTRTVMDAGCECAPRVRSANPSDSWALVKITHKLVSFTFLLRPLGVTFFCSLHTMCGCRMSLNYTARLRPMMMMMMMMMVSGVYW